MAALSVPLRKVKEQAAGTALECDPSSKAGPSGSPNTTICDGTGTRRGEGGTVGKKTGELPR